MLCWTADAIQNATQRRCVNGGSKTNDLMPKGCRRGILRIEPTRLASGLGTESLSRISTTEHTEHTETILAPFMPCFRGFGVFRGSQIFGDKSRYMVAAPASRVGRGASEGESRVRLLGFSPEGDTCLPVCVSHRTLVTTQPCSIF